MSQKLQYISYCLLSIRQKIGLCFQGGTTLEKAINQYKARNYKQAFDGCSRLVEMGSIQEVRKIWRTALECCLKLNHSKEQIAVFLEGLCRVANIAELNFEVARRWQDIQQYYRTCFWLRETIKLDPHFQDSYERLYDLVKEQGQSEGMAILSEWYHHNLFNTTVILRIAHKHTQSGLFNQSLPYYERLIELNPKEEQYYKKYVELQARIVLYGRKRSLLYCETALDFAKQPQFFHTAKGNLLIYEQRFDQALDCFRRALLINRQYKGAYIKILFMAARFQQGELVCDFLKQMVRKEQLGYCGKALLAASLFYSARYQEFHKVRQQVLSPGNKQQKEYDYFVGLSQLCEADYRSAAKTIEKSSPQFGLEYCYEKTQQYDRIISHFKDTAEWSVFYFDDLTLLVDSYHKIGDASREDLHIQKCLSTMKRVKMIKRFSFIKVLMNIGRAQQFCHAFDFEELDVFADRLMYRFVGPCITLVEYYYQSDQVEKAYGRLHSLIERISLRKNNSCFVTIQCQELVRTIEMCLLFAEFASAQGIIQSVKGLYKFEKRHPRLGKWREEIDSNKALYSTPNP